MGTAKLVSMIAQPIQISYLAFEIGGVLDTCEARLGAAVQDISYSKLCGSLRIGKTTTADPSRLIHDANGVKNLVTPYCLASLRNEDRKAALNTAVNSRQNAYFAKYAGAAQIISTIRASYWRGSPASKANQLQMLDDIAEQQYADLQQAYMDDGRTGVVKTTVSSTASSSSATGLADRWQGFIQQAFPRTVPGAEWLPANLPWPDDGYASIQFQPGDSVPTAITSGNTQDRTKSSGDSRGTQSSEHTDYEYRTPSLESRARKTRAHISLIDQKFETYMFGQNIPHLEKVFENELNSIDNDVYQIQIALLRSYLTSPGSGVITGLYKRPGEAVSAGEPVVRVEHNNTVQLIATIVHRGPIAPGSTATVTTTLAGGASAATTFAGAVVAARGQGDGDRWEVVVEVPNVDSGGNFVVPLGYVFDREYTAMTIV